MKLIRFTTQDKEFNATPYKEYKLYCSSSTGNICITTTGRTSVVYIADDGTVLDETRLDKSTLNRGDELTFWRDDLGKLVQIDVLVSSSSPSDDIATPF